MFWYYRVNAQVKHQQRCCIRIWLKIIRGAPVQVVEHHIQWDDMKSFHLTHTF